MQRFRFTYSLVLVFGIVIVAMTNALVGAETHGAKAPAYAIFGGAILITWLAPPNTSITGKDTLLPWAAAAATLLAGWHWWLDGNELEFSLLWACVVLTTVVSLTMVVCTLIATCFTRNPG